MAICSYCLLSWAVQFWNICEKPKVATITPTSLNSPPPFLILSPGQLVRQIDAEAALLNS